MWDTGGGTQREAELLLLRSQTGLFFFTCLKCPQICVTESLQHRAVPGTAQGPWPTVLSHLLPELDTVAADGTDPGQNHPQALLVPLG